MKVYKGDIITHSKDDKGIPIRWKWGSNGLIGVTKSVEISSDEFVLFSRPFLTKVKLFLGIIK